jgi:hypothetical protein
VSERAFMRARVPVSPRLVADGDGGGGDGTGGSLTDESASMTRG